MPGRGEALPLEQQLQGLLGRSEGSVGVQEAGDIGEVRWPEGGTRCSGFSGGLLCDLPHPEDSSRFRADPFFTWGNFQTSGIV